MKHLFQAAGCRTGPSVGAPRIDGELLKLGIGILEASSQLSIDGMAHGLWILRLILSPRIGERRADRQGRSHTRYDACRRRSNDSREGGDPDRCASCCSEDQPVVRPAGTKA